jgi:hypothetical protein
MVASTAHTDYVCFLIDLDFLFSELYFLYGVVLDIGTIAVTGILGHT